MIKYIILFTICFISFNSSLLAKFEVVNVNNATEGECNGSIDILATGNFGPYEFTWSNGENNEDIDNLCSGTYTVTITNIYGCERYLTASVAGCDMNIEETITHVCRESLGSILLNVDVFNNDYLWSNGSQEKDIFNLEAGFYCVTITNVKNNCFYERCYIVSEICNTPPDPLVIINEISNGAYSSKEYIELLIIGDGSCEDFDLRGYILDDNNSIFSNYNEVPGVIRSGVASGHIRFSNINRWANVPIGSIILIYNQDDKNSIITIADDPADTDMDKVYVLPINDSGLEGTMLYPGVWTTKEYHPNTTQYSTASWDAIAMFNGGDGFQVRYPNGEYCHGISYGRKLKINGGPHNLHISENDGYQKYYYFNQGDYLNKNHYTESSIYPYGQTSIQTPGFPNNQDNYCFINSLCGEPCFLGLSENSNTDIASQKQFSEEDLKIAIDKYHFSVAKVFPNPFVNSVNIETVSTESQEISVYVYDLFGRLVYHQNQPINEGTDMITIILDKGLSEGFYIINIVDYLGNTSAHKITNNKGK